MLTTCLMRYKLAKIDILILSAKGSLYNSSIEYQDLLALEERMGDVSTGLDEEAIMKFMKQRNYSSVTTEGPSKMEPCCICQVISLIEMRFYLSHCDCLIFIHSSHDQNM